MKTNRSLSLRLLSVLLCLCMVLGMLPAIAMAEGETITIYCDTTAAGWYHPYVYVWNSDDLALSTWPGKAMTLVEGNIYSIQVPAGTEVINFNDYGVGGTLVGTSDLTIPTDDTNLYSVETDTWSIYEGSSNTLTLYFENMDGWGIPNAYAWNADGELLGQWPGTAMTSVGGNTYSIQAPSDAAFIIFNDGINQTADLSMPTDGNNLYSIATGGWSVYGGEVCDHNYEGVVTPPTCTAAGYTTYTCTLCGGSYTADPVAATGHSYGDDTICDICGDEYICITIYFENGDGWGVPNAYAMAANYQGLLDPWPGTAMTHVEGNTYSIQVPSDAAFIIFNDGINQTADLSMPTDGNNLYNIATNGWSVYGGEVCDHNYEGVVTPPTCTAAGYTTYTCTLCGDSYTADPVAATGHSYGDDTICDICGDEYICITIYFENGDGWGVPNAYAWTEDMFQLGPWPGTAMTLVEGNIYSIQVPAEAEKIIFNDGANQTYDLDLPTDGANLYTYATDSWSIYQGGSGEGGEETSAKITIHMVDYCCDGWDTNAIAVQINRQLHTLVTMEDGEEATYELDYDENNVYSFLWVNGDYPEECGFEILIDGKEVFAAEVGDCTEYEYGKLLYTNCIHSFDEGTVTPPTCTAEGYTIYTCDLCYYVDKRDVVAANGHSFGEDGLCTVCGNLRSIAIELTDSYGDGWNGNYIHVYADGVRLISFTVEDEEHTAFWGVNYDPETLYTVKWEVGDYPDECGIRILIDDVAVWSVEDCSLFEDGQIIYANCDHSYDDGVLTPPTCTEDGKTVYTCTVCGCIDVVIEGTTGHTPDGEGTVVPPTCTDYGYTEYHCANCGEYFTEEIVDPLGHSYGDDHVCDVCGNENLITLYFKNTGNWAQPYAYGWNTTTNGILGDWPGTAMTHLQDDIYSITVPATVEYIIFNNNQGMQTDDLLVPTDGNNLFTYGASDWETKGEIKLLYPSLSFDEEIRYNIYFTIFGMEVDVDDMGLILFDSMLTNGTMDDAIEVIPGVARGESEYGAQTNGIPAKKMGDTIYFKVYAQLEDGSYVYSNIQSYSAVEYAMDRLANSANEELKRLCVAMLNYGAAAQVYFGYKTDSLMNAGLTEAQKALVEDYRADMVADIVAADSAKAGAFAANGGFGIKYPSVSFEGAFAINYVFKTTLPVDADVKLYYWSLDTYYNADELTVENADGWAEMTGKNGFYKAAVEGIYAKNIDQTIFVAGVYESDGETYSTGVLAYSLGAYCADRAEKGNEPMPALAKATAVYGYYAKQYFGW